MFTLNYSSKLNSDCQCEFSLELLREKLKLKTFPSNEIDAAINEIKEHGYLRQDAYTEARIKGFMNKG